MRSDLGGLPAAARRSRMKAIVERRGFALVTDLARLFEVSEVTARADLDALAEERLVRRVHGGAMSVELVERHVHESATPGSQAEKQRIGIAAAGLVESHQVISLDAGTTTLAVARALVNRDLENVTIVTNALDIALELESAIPRYTVIVTGGTLRPSFHGLVDPLADALIHRVRTDIAFVGSNGIDVAAGVSNLSLAEADVKRRFMDNAARTILVADSSKLGVVRASKVCGVDGIAVLVTGQEADEAGVALLRDTGLKVVLA